MTSHSHLVSAFDLLTLSERRGMTLHLLKQSAKPSKPREVRKKYPVLDFDQFVEEKKDAKDGKPGD